MDSILKDIKEIVFSRGSEYGKINSIIQVLTNLTKARVVIGDSRGMSLAGLLGEEVVDKASNNRLLAIITTQQGSGSTVIPIFRDNERIATLVIFNEETLPPAHLFVAEACGALLSLLIGSVLEKDATNKDMELSKTRAAINMLTFSELSAINLIFDQLDPDRGEGIIVAKKIAHKAKIAHSVIVSVLKKLESAGLLTSRSMGAKGTYIKIQNKGLITEIRKLRG